MLKNYEEWLNEKSQGLWANIRAKRARGAKPARKGSKAYKRAVAAAQEIREAANFSEKLPPLVQDFIAQLIKNPDDPYAYLDWWCVPDEKMLIDAIFARFGGQVAAEKFESEQRKLPQNQRLLSDYFLLEFQSSVNKTQSHEYFLVGIDMKSKELHCKDREWTKSLEKAFDVSLKKHFPTQHASRKFGL
jgi:hypothetical protein